MITSEAIRNNNNFIITKDGKILAINSINEKLVNVEVKKIQIVKGIYSDITCIRL